MRACRTIVGSSLLSIYFAASTLLAQSAAPPVKGPWLGVWKLNVEKSTYQMGAPPAGTIRTVSMVAAGPDSFDIIIDSQAPNGGPSMHMELKGGKFDGKDYKESGNPIADANRFRILGPRSYEVIETKDGVEVITVSVEVSPDGKTRTSRQQSKGRDGKPVVNIAVWERQQ